MEHVRKSIILEKLIEITHNKQPYSIPCWILKSDEYKKLDVLNYLMDKDILAQILYEVFYKNELPSEGIPLVISLKNNLINRMESEGVYVLDSSKDQFVYLFGFVDHQEFFEKLFKIKDASKINASLVLAFLTPNEDYLTNIHSYLDKLNRLIVLHGSVSGNYMILDANEGVTFPLMNKEFKLNSFYWIDNKEEVDEEYEF